MANTFPRSMQGPRRLEAASCLKSPVIPNMCNSCPMIFTSKKLLLRHLLMDPKHNPERLCITCLQEFPPGEGWTQYMVIHCVENECAESPMMKRLSCKICPAWFKTEEAFKAHILSKMHLDMRMRHCPECQAGFPRKQLCDEHVCPGPRKALCQTRDAPENALSPTSSIKSSNGIVIGQNNTPQLIEGASKVSVDAVQKAPMDPHQQQHGDPSTVVAEQIMKEATVVPGSTTRGLVEGAPTATLQTSSNSNTTIKKEEKVIKYKIIVPDPAIVQQAKAKTMSPQAADDWFKQEMLSLLQEERAKRLPEITRAASEYYAPQTKLDPRTSVAQSSKSTSQLPMAAGQNSPVLDQYSQQQQPTNIPPKGSMVARQSSPMLRPDSRQQQGGTSNTPKSYTSCMSYVSPWTLDKSDPLLFVSAERFEAIKAATLLKLAAERNGTQPGQSTPAAAPVESGTPAVQPFRQALGYERYVPSFREANVAVGGSLGSGSWVSSVEDSEADSSDKNRSVSPERTSQMEAEERFEQENFWYEGTGSSEVYTESESEPEFTYVPRNPAVAEVEDRVMDSFGQNKRIGSVDSIAEMLHSTCSEICPAAPMIQRAQGYQEEDQDDRDYQEYKKAEKLHAAQFSPPKAPKAMLRRSANQREIVNRNADDIDLTKIPKVEPWRFKRYPCYPFKCTACRLIFLNENELRSHHAKIEHKWEKWCVFCDTIVEGNHPCGQWSNGREWEFADRKN